MQYLVKVEKGSVAKTLPPLNAAEAQQRLQSAEALGLAVQCSDSDRRLVSREQLQAATKSR